MPRLLAIPLAPIVFLALSCGGEDGENSESATGATGGGALAVATATLEASSGDKATPAPTPEPGAISVANEAFSVETPDSAVLRGHAYTPDGPKRQALIIVAPVEQSIWAESTRAFTSEGIAVFTFDPRGFGETGGAADAGALADDARLLAHFVMSREYPLVYLFGVGGDGAQAGVDAAGTLETLSGLITYGLAGEATAPNHVALGGDATWDGEDLLAVEAVRDRVLAVVLGRN